MGSNVIIKTIKRLHQNILNLGYLNQTNDFSNSSNWLKSVVNKGNLSKIYVASWNSGYLTHYLSSTILLGLVSNNYVPLVKSTTWNFRFTYFPLKSFLGIPSLIWSKSLGVRKKDFVSFREFPVFNAINENLWLKIICSLTLASNKPFKDLTTSSIKTWPYLFVIGM